LAALELPHDTPVDDAALARVRGPSEASVKAAELAGRKAKKKMRKDGIMLFNSKPKKGIAQLQAQGLLSTEPAEVARFLRATEGLEYAAIGDYLSDPADDCKAVRLHASK
jgi:Sec7-like guanine-nucleotide exchange factor